MQKLSRSIIKDSKLECSSFRTISFPSDFDKILEKLIHNRLIKFLTAQKILYLERFGFSKTFSTAYIIINLVDSIEKAIDHDKFACAIFIDHKKTCEIVDREILLKKVVASCSKRHK